MILTIANAMPGVSITIEKDLTVTTTRVGSEGSLHAATLITVLAAQDPRGIDFSNFKTRCLHEFKDINGMTFKFYGIKIASCPLIDMFITWAGNLLYVSRVNTEVNFESDMKGSENITDVKYQYAFVKYEGSTIRNQENLKRTINSNIPVQYRAQIYKQLCIDPVYYVD